MTPDAEPTKTTSRSLAWLGVVCLVGSALIAASAIWVDLPLARALFNRESAELTDQFFNSSPPVLVHAIPDLGLIAILFVLARRSGGHLNRFFLMSGTVGLCAYAITELLFKPIFGRSDPHDWVWHHRSAFHFFSPVGGSYSFPSGHAALATGALAMLWLMQKPRSAVPLAAICGFDLAMVAMNIHFLSDVLAGSLLGYGLALLTSLLWTSNRSPESTSR